MIHEITLLQLYAVEKEVASVKQNILLCWRL